MQRRGSCGRHIGRLGGLVPGLIALALFAGQVTEVAAEVTCTPLGTVSFGGLTVEPDSPRVGDEVVLHFAVQIAVYSLTSVNLLGAPPLLEGNTFGSRDATFNLEAVQAGTAEVSLQVTYATEEQCTDDSGGMPIFRPGPSFTVTSQLFLVPIAAEPTPTSTSTPTATSTASPTGTPSPTNTATPPSNGNGGGGCAAAAPDAAGAALVLPLYALLRRRRREPGPARQR